MDMLKLAVKQLGNEVDFKKRKSFTDKEIIDYMIMIKKHKDYQLEVKLLRKLRGEKLYRAIDF